ncbi:universal stress protein [Streptomyces sp. WMMB 322]|uniref:universal stress protein n=1 Tax=Streptomyces sp. WMMB 322 TaxID=1286821 RepID=UPI000823F78A|nr:universal stress protein [Streptomyces sp. WMMB 322]SCK54827.1 Nucleotide-binding universal stress protein, UspA family [Streptomyces sp. WMMB 322]
MTSTHEPPHVPPAVAGVEADPGRRLALAWAVDEADRRGIPLRLVHAWGSPAATLRSAESGDLRQERDALLRARGEGALEQAAAFAAQRRPGVGVSTVLAEGEAAWVMRQQAEDAAFVVLGSWGLSERKALFSSSSVVLPVLADAPCPVVVVREAEHVTTRPPYFVVGVDGSSDSGAAVDFAFKEASLRGADLRALYVRHPSRRGGDDDDAAVQESRALLSETVAGRTAADPDVGVYHEVLGGHPVDVLTRESAHALGLVVGTRGHGGFAGMLLGSVSQGAVHHAQCPVIVVPAGARSH